MTDSNSTRRSPRFIDLTGKQFGKWTVIAEAEKHPSRSNTYWTCLCECGTEKSVNGAKLTGNRSRSCKPCSKQHGMCDTQEYYSWGGMKQRCTNQNVKAFPSYGGSGKTVCAGWNSFENFYADMGPKPSPPHSVDRIDGSKGYSCGHCVECVENGWTANCRWATKAEQARNRRSNQLITFNNKTMCLADWVAEVGIGFQTLYSRLKHGWSIERALTEPVKVKS